MCLKGVLVIPNGITILHCVTLMGFRLYSVQRTVIAGVLFYFCLRSSHNPMLSLGELETDLQGLRFPSCCWCAYETQGNHVWGFLFRGKSLQFLMEPQWSFSCIQHKECLLTMLSFFSMKLWFYAWSEPLLMLLAKCFRHLDRLHPIGNSIELWLNKIYRTLAHAGDQMFQG